MTNRTDGTTQQQACANGKSDNDSKKGNKRQAVIKVVSMLAVLIAVSNLFYGVSVAGKWGLANTNLSKSSFVFSSSSPPPPRLPSPLTPPPPPPLLTNEEVADAQEQLQAIYEGYADAGRPRHFSLRGVGWVHAHLGLVLTMKVVFHPQSGAGKERRLTVYVLDASGVDEKCDEEKARLLTIWIRVLGQYEVMSGDAQLVPGGHPQSRGSCLWQYSTDLVTELSESAAAERLEGVFPVVPQSFKVDAKILGWNAHVDYHFEPMCNVTKGPPEEDDLIRHAVLESPQQTYFNSSFYGFKFYNPDQTCCEICSRLANCVRWAIPGFTKRIHPVRGKDNKELEAQTDCELIVVRAGSETVLDDYDYLDKVYDAIVHENQSNQTLVPARLPFGKELLALRKRDIQTELLLGRFPRPPSASVNYTFSASTDGNRMLTTRNDNQHLPSFELRRYSWTDPSEEPEPDWHAEQEFFVNKQSHRYRKRRRRLQDNNVPMHGVPRKEPLGYFLGCGWTQWHSLEYPCVSTQFDDAILNSGQNFIWEDNVQVAEWKADEELVQPREENNVEGLDANEEVKNAYETRAASFPFCTWEDEFLNSTSDPFGRWVRRPGLAVDAAGSDCPIEDYPLDLNKNFTRRAPIHLHAPKHPLCWYREFLKWVSDRCMEQGCKHIKDDLWRSALFRESAGIARWFGWWQPSTCRYAEMTDDEINDCFRRRRFADFLPAGRSIMHFFTDYVRARLSTVYHEPVDNDGDNSDGATFLHVDSLEMPWALCEKSEEEFRDTLIDKPNATKTDEYYYLSGFYFSSERGMHVTAARSRRFNEIAEEVLLAKGWHVLNAYDLTRTFTFDTSAQFDGMHIIGPPMKALVTKVLHHFCHSPV